MTDALEHLPQPSGLDWSHAFSRRCHDRQILFYEGDQKVWVYRVESGAVCLYRVFADGRRHIFEFRFPNDVIGLGQSDKCPLTAQVLGTTRLKCLDFKRLHDAAAQDANVAMQLYSAISSELEAMGDHLVAICRQDSVGRIASFLLTLSLRNGSRSPNILNLPMTRGEVADFLGMKTETVSRALTKLSQLEMIEVRGRSKINIKDIHRLDRLAPMGPEHLLPKSREYWLARAKRAYALAEQMRDPLTKNSYLSVAKSSEKLARFAAPQTNLSDPPNEAHKNEPE
jgi:CRP/FNR family transcriptional regulator, anaerobic regulatory protein